MGQQPTQDKDHPTPPFEPVWRPKRQSEVVGSIWVNAVIGFVVAILTGLATVQFTVGLPRSFITAVWASVVIGLLVVMGLISLKTRRTGLLGGVLLAMGLCLLIPVVGVLAICGNFMFK